MLNSLFSIVIDLWICTFLGPVSQKFIFSFEDEFSLFLSIDQVECRDVIDFKFKRSVGYPLPVVDWAETVLIPESRQLSSVRSDLVWWINCDCFTVDEFVS